MILKDTIVEDWKDGQRVYGDIYRSITETNDNTKINRTNQDGISLLDGNAIRTGIDNTVTITSGHVYYLNTGGWLSTFLSPAGAKLPENRLNNVGKIVELKGFNSNDPYWITNYSSDRSVSFPSMNQNVIWLQSAESRKAADSIRNLNLERGRNGYKTYRAFTIDSVSIGKYKER